MLLTSFNTIGIFYDSATATCKHFALKHNASLIYPLTCSMRDSKAQSMHVY